MRARNRAFPFAEVEPGEKHLQMLADVSLPDEDDRHVLAAALAVDATVLCTSNTKDFPASAVEPFGIEVATSDDSRERRGHGGCRRGDDGAVATSLAIQTGPDVILMDIRMPEIDGLEATRRCRTGHGS